MSISLTDAQLKQTSKDILLLPFVINDPQTGYVAEKAALQVQTNVLLADDNNKAVFYNFWKDDVVAKYHSELDYLNSSLRTNYSNSDLIDGGNQTGNHYTIPWTKLSPKILSSMNGNPVTTSATVNEVFLSNKIKEFSNYIQNGFSDGTDLSNVSSITANSFQVDSGSSPSIGNRIMIDSGVSTYIFGFVTNVSGINVTYTFTGGVLFSSGVCTNYMSGFSEAERNHSLASPTLMLFLENQISTGVTDWQSNITNQKANLDTNGDYAPRKVTNILASADIFSLLLVLSGWAALPYNTQYANAGIVILQNASATRVTQVSARISQISSDLGSVSQNGVGTYSGTGAYFELTNIINIRISRSGSLCSYNSSFLGIAYFDKIIADANSQLTSYEMTMVVKKITQDVAISDLVVKVDSTSQLSIGNSIKLFDNDSNVYSRTISNIVGLNVTLNLAMVAPLLTSKLARLVKEL